MRIPLFTCNRIWAISFNKLVLGSENGTGRAHTWSHVPTLKTLKITDLECCEFVNIPMLLKRWCVRHTGIPPGIPVYVCAV